MVCVLEHCTARISYVCVLLAMACANPKGREDGGRGTGPSLKKSQNIGFHSNTGPDPLKNH